MIVGSAPRAAHCLRSHREIEHFRTSFIGENAAAYCLGQAFSLCATDAVSPSRRVSIIHSGDQSMACKKQPPREDRRKLPPREGARK